MEIALSRIDREQKYGFRDACSYGFPYCPKREIRDVIEFLPV